MRKAQTDKRQYEITSAFLTNKWPFYKNYVFSIYVSGKLICRSYFLRFFKQDRYTKLNDFASIGFDLDVIIYGWNIYKRCKSILRRCRICCQ